MKLYVVFTILMVMGNVIVLMQDTVVRAISMNVMKWNTLLSILNQKIQ